MAIEEFFVVFFQEMLQLAKNYNKVCEVIEFPMDWFHMF